MTVWWKWFRYRWYIAIPLLIIDFAAIFGREPKELELEHYNCVVQCSLSQVKPLSLLASVGQHYG